MTPKTREQQARERVAKSWDEYKRAYQIGSDIEQGRAWDHMNHAIKDLLSLPPAEAVSDEEIARKLYEHIRGIPIDDFMATDKVTRSALDLIIAGFRAGQKKMEGGVE